MTTLRPTTSLLRHVTSRAHTRTGSHNYQQPVRIHSLFQQALDSILVFFFVVCKFHTLRPTVNVLSFGHTQEKSLDFDRFSANFSRCLPDWPSKLPGKTPRKWWRMMIFLFVGFSRCVRAWRKTLTHTYTRNAHKHTRSRTSRGKLLILRFAN